MRFFIVGKRKRGNENLRLFFLRIEKYGRSRTNTQALKRVMCACFWLLVFQRSRKIVKGTNHSEVQHTRHYILKRLQSVLSIFTLQIA
jgi:hypothetical protein